ncbi:MAG: radical SAM family heme chaperone HemW [Dehalococcoidia bacterium]
MNSKRHEISLYVHIPFCTFKCFYCDFNTYAGLEGLIPSYVEGLNVEISRWGTVLSNGHSNEDKFIVKSVFFGGGTPSLLNGNQLESIMNTISANFSFSKDLEITLEANPESIETQKISDYRSAGVNRVSIGGQSTKNSELIMLGRLHNENQLTQAFMNVQKAKIENINIDFMYNLPGQTTQDWVDTLSDAVNFEADHLSLYGLTVEENTPFYSSINNGDLPKPDDDIGAIMYEIAQEKLDSSGYTQYEISNWAKPNKESVHNLHYWENGDFIGFGPGAFSHLGKTRFSNIRQPREYLKRIERLEKERSLQEISFDFSSGTDKNLLSAISPLDEFDPYSTVKEVKEATILNLRLNAGIDLIQFEELYQINLTTIFENAIETSISDKLLLLEDGNLKLTDKGRLLSNEVFVRIMNEKDSIVEK